MDEAAKMIRADGEQAFSMRKLAAKTGVSRTAPYHHFTDKQALLCAIAEEGFRRFMLFDGSVVKDPETGMIARSVLDGFVRGYVRFAIENAEYYDLMFGGHLWKDRQLTESLTRESHASFRRYVDGVRHWQEQALILESIDPLRYAQVSWSTLHGMSRLLIDGIYVDEAAIEPICQNAAAMLWSELTGLRH
ncbi:TetR/AcrR family transcriptional regulator [Aestuariicella hydrocarbonica]|uniref:TetR/AcrR family transcriptional regulator n=2 Tax=Pseudomaricurvus hydrocarbonicus TaxID=1470433 RepID=A0A9E5JRL0_9GAMM|nr:TetR/AcrR family transcriptional regulator [Aestuariicella hydrocarbonica]